MMASLQDPAGDEGAVSEVGLWPAHDYTKGSLNRNIWLLAVPMALEMSMTSIFQIIDIFWVGKIGPAAVAAVTISGTLRWGINSLAMGLGIGSMAVVARRIGEKDRPAANHATLHLRRRWIATLSVTVWPDPIASTSSVPAGNEQAFVGSFHRTFRTE